MLDIAILIILLVAINALYVAAEFASVSVPQTRIELLAREGHSNARRLLCHLRDVTSLDRYVAVCQIGITASSLVLGAYGQRALAGWLVDRLVGWGSLQVPLAESMAATMVLLVLTFLQVVLGELVPKSIAVRYPERTAFLLLWPMEASLRAFAWFVWLLNGTSTLILRLLRVPVHAHRHVHSPEEIEHLLTQEARVSGLGEDDRRQLGRMRSVLRFAEKTVQDLMVPRPQMSTIQVDATQDEIRGLTADSPYTRFPVYGKSIDDVLGLVHVKDLTLAIADPGHACNLKSLLRPMLSLPASLQAEHALEKMRAERAQMALVLDEYGGTAGLVTMENLVEEILGDLVDEFDREEPSLVEVAPGEVLASGRTLLARLEEVLGIDLEPKPVHTVGGLLMYRLGSPLAPGATIDEGGVRFTIREVEGPRILQVHVQRTVPGPP